MPRVKAEKKRQNNFSNYRSPFDSDYFSVIPIIHVLNSYFIDIAIIIKSIKISQAVWFIAFVIIRK